MIKQKHGGNLREIARAYGVAEKEILDFSANINPLGTPKPVLRAILEEMDRLVHYPESDAGSLREKAAEKDRIAVEHILAGNGSTEFLYLIPRVLKPRRVLLLSPTYPDYARAFSEVGADLLDLPLQREEGFAFPLDDCIEKMKEGVDLLLLCNPNNPTGSLIGLEEVREILQTARFTDTTVVIDEAYIDFIPGGSARFQVTASEHLLVVRSLSAFYGIPGLRAGLLYGSGPLLKRIGDHQEPWTVNRLSQAAALAGLDDEEHRQKVHQEVRGERESLLRGLETVPGVRVFPSEANFLLLEVSPPLPEPGRLFEMLVLSGILVRHCTDFSGLGSRFFRVTVRTGEENRLLLESLRQAVRKMT